MTKTAQIGVIVGRFQAHVLHDAHVELIQHVVDRHRKVLLFLGQPKTIATKRNPLDFTARKLMVLERFPELTVLPITDMKSDVEWSRTLDEKIREIFPVGDVLLYGSRDSFIPHYTGNFPTEELEPSSYVSATELRETCGRQVKASADFRAGVIYVTQNRFPITYTTVDVAVLRPRSDGKYDVLVGRKPHQTLWQFIGGFVDPTDRNCSMAVVREAKEEANVDIGDLLYLGTFRIPDWRYVGEEDGIMTIFFSAMYRGGAVEPRDDLAELRWVPVDQTLPLLLEPEHQELATALRTSLGNQL